MRNVTERGQTDYRDVSVAVHGGSPLSTVADQSLNIHNEDGGNEAGRVSAAFINCYRKPLTRAVRVLGWYLCGSFAGCVSSIPRIRESGAITNLHGS